MTTFRIDDAVCDAFPDVMVLLVVAHDVSGAHSWPAVEAALATLEDDLAEERWAPPSDDDPRIASWHEAYRRFGTNPRRVRPSVEALGRRLARTGRLPRISGAVDAYNLVSVTSGFPVGAFDLKRITGDVTIRYARDGDTFTPLGEPDTVEHPQPGEVVYADDRRVLTRHWNHRDAEATKVTPVTRDIIYVLETVAATEHRTQLEEAARALCTHLARHADRALIEILDASTREAPTPE